MKLVALILIAVIALSGCPGEKGEKGEPGASQPCTVVDNGNGTATMTCPDGTSVVIPVATDGGTAADGSTVVDGAPGQDSAAGMDTSAGVDGAAGQDAASGLDSGQGTDASAEDGGAAAGPCDGFDPAVVVEGSYTIENSVDLRAFAGTRCITGNLTIAAPGMTGYFDGTLRKVGGDLVIQLNDVLESIDLPVLASVGGGLEVHFNAALTSLSLPVLASVGSSFNVCQNPALPNCMAINLRDQVQAAQGISGTIEIVANDDPCVPDLCSSGTCNMDCSAPQNYRCLAAVFDWAQLTTYGDSFSADAPITFAVGQDNKLAIGYAPGP